MLIQGEISRREARAAAKGKDIAREDPLGLLDSAVATVLNDEQNSEICKAINEGRAFTFKKFDPRKRPPGNTNGDPNGESGNPTGKPQTWTTGGRACATAWSAPTKICQTGNVATYRQRLPQR